MPHTPFMDKDFLLRTDTAKVLFHSHASRLPIIDYHCHLSPREVAEDKRFSTITELWLGGDHYKWRAMRSNGVDEKYITGDASDWEKFQKWAETMPYCMRNPLYHWTHLELRTAFGIDTLLNASTAREIYDRCNEALASPEFSARSLMKRYNVELVCTTDDPADSLAYHRQVRDEGFEVRMLPAWRPDKVLGVDCPQTFGQYIQTLAEAADTDIATCADLKDALQKRHDFFASMGCRLSDHGILRFYDEDFNEAEVEAVFSKAMRGLTPTPGETAKYRAALMTFMAEQDADAGWTQQFHYGVLRNNNSRMFERLGADSGFDSIGAQDTSRSMARFLDRLDSEGKLAQTILYCINPSDNEMLATMAGNFQQGPVPGKIQMGSGWWFNDQLDGMRRQINALSTLGLLSRFVGMLTDSRSFLSYPRHEYFRRLLCDILGEDVERGLLPEQELPFICRMVEDISYYNAKRYFRFDK